MDDEWGRRVLVRTPAWVVADKPAGMETVVKGGGDGARCFTSALRRSLERPGLAPAHRLDTDTTGCVLFGCDAETVQTLEASFRRRDVEKHYLALCVGAPRNPQGVIRRKLSKWTGGRRPIQTVKGKHGYEAETAYRVLGTAGIRDPQAPELEVVSLIRFAPRTGRTHQIRVHAEALGRPVAGDHRYGDRAANRVFKERFGLARQALHAWRITFPDPETGEANTAEAPIPADMAAILDELLPRWPDLLGDARRD